MVSTVLGLSVMVSPTKFGVPIESQAADVAHLGGALIVTVSVISMGEVIRLGRYLNVILGLIVIITPWGTEGGTIGYSITITLLGILAIVLALPSGPKREVYGMCDPYVR